MAKSREELNDKLDIANDLQQEHDQCPECGRDYEHTDVTRGGEIVFVHGQATPSTVSTCTFTGDI